MLFENLTNNEIGYDCILKQNDNKYICTYNGKSNDFYTFKPKDLENLPDNDYLLMGEIIVPINNNSFELLLCNKNMEYTKDINEQWNFYDKIVARTHLDQFGIIILDNNKEPIDDFESLQLINEEYEKI